jgi:phage gp46-like protein
MDLKLVENNNGGDLSFNGKDLEIVRGWQNMPYLDLFGGNVEGSTKELKEGEQSFDWWGNTLLFDQQQQYQVNSEFERLLKNVSISSFGRIQLEQATKNDLKGFNSFAEITVKLSIVSADRLSLFIQIKEPSNLQSDIFKYIWDSTKNELIIED